ncbi:YetF domain-containing protein [Cohnella kolymensis]|uniref:YetF domain-containing protein n=1 Tax=Cohnella kolymensis TaxID=1590652 RepID=UPI000AC4AF08
MKLHSSDSNFPIELIIDGKFVEKNLHENHISKRNVQHQIKKMNKRTEDVFYAVQGSDGKLYIDLYRHDIENPIDKE